MQHFHPGGHWPLDALDLAAAGEEAALEPQHGFSTLLVDRRTDGKQAVRVARVLVPWRIAATNNNLGGCFLDNLEVVGELCAGLICRLGQLVDGPQLGAGGRAMVLARKICPLESVS